MAARVAARADKDQKASKASSGGVGLNETLKDAKDAANTVEDSAKGR